MSVIVEVNLNNDPAPHTAQLTVITVASVLPRRVNDHRGIGQHTVAPALIASTAWRPSTERQRERTRPSSIRLRVSAVSHHAWRVDHMSPVPRPPPSRHAGSDQA